MPVMQTSEKNHKTQERQCVSWTVMNKICFEKMHRFIMRVCRIYWRAVRCLNRVLLGRSAGNIPRSVILYLPERFAQPRVQRHIVSSGIEAEAEIVRYKYESDIPEFFILEHSHRPRHWYRLRDVNVSATTGLVWTPEGDILCESIGSLNKLLSWGQCMHETLFPHSMMMQQHSGALLSCPPRSYCHWLIEVLPFTWSLAQRAPEARLLLRDALPGYVRESLSMALPTKYKQAVRSPGVVRASELWFVSQNERTVRPIDPWLTRKIFGCLKNNPVCENRKLYLSRNRAKARHVANENRIEDMMRLAGFDVVYAEEIPFREQVNLFRDTSVIAGIHGAGLTNMVFAPSSCVIMEIFTPDYYNDLFARLATMLNLKYRWCRPKWKGKSSQRELDIEIIEKWLGQ
jgi:hypothetical protein